jgi:hypothetical protein
LSRFLQKLMTSSSVYHRVVFTIVQFVTRPSPETAHAQHIEKLYKWRIIQDPSQCPPYLPPNRFLRFLYCFSILMHVSDL